MSELTYTHNLPDSFGMKRVTSIKIEKKNFPNWETLLPHPIVSVLNSDAESYWLNLDILTLLYQNSFPNDETAWLPFDLACLIAFEAFSEHTQPQLENSESESQVCDFDEQRRRGAELLHPLEESHWLCQATDPRTQEKVILFTPAAHRLLPVLDDLCKDEQGDPMEVMQSIVLELESSSSRWLAYNHASKMLVQVKRLCLKQLHEFTALIGEVSQLEKDQVGIWIGQYADGRAYQNYNRLRSGRSIEFWCAGVERKIDKDWDHVKEIVSDYQGQNRTAAELEQDAKYLYSIFRQMASDLKTIQKLVHEMDAVAAKIAHIWGGQLRYALHPDER
jgi:hypothetical protein